MTEYINRQAAIDSIRFFMTPASSGYEEYLRDEICGNILANLPAADVQEVKHGKWVVSEWDDNFVYCSWCKEHKHKLDVRGYSKEYAKTIQYCQYCGAKMEE